MTDLQKAGWKLSVSKGYQDPVTGQFVTANTARLRQKNRIEFPTREIRITEKQWEEWYQPIKNKVLKDEAPFEGHMFETYGKEMAFLKKADIHTIWTIYCEGDYMCYLSGSHYINRMGYFVTQRPWTFDMHVTVRQ